ncbi:MAG TPA: hypothetical protein DDW19_05400 [Anaerolineaceae bacterium]|jgi:pSer/pThr/pTyr-binding forkhead associated (FHA) protein|nr:hypothetical protein [Anaerolineaceae bacterium]
MANPIDLIESKIKEIIESSVLLFPWMDEHAISVHRLVEAFQTFINNRDESSGELPAQFVIYMNPTECSRWKSQAEWESAISHTLIDTAREVGLKFDRPLSIQLIPSSALNYYEVQIDRSVETVDPGLTNAVPVEIHEPIEKKGGAQPSQAGLILENEKIYSLNRAVTNIGRRSTNHLVVSDLRVSRNHAQVRLVNGRYMIFDAGSTGGTYINGERIQQSTLRPGDVISLAGVKLIFVVDERDDETNPIRTDTRPS